MAKHALLLAAIARLSGVRTALTVFDTHAGAGVYDLDAEAARRSGEAKAGIACLIAEADPPAVLRPLVEAVGVCNGNGRLRLYPGSPWLAARALKRGDRYVGCELRADDGAALRRSLPSDAAARIVIQVADGFQQAADHFAVDPSLTLLLVDPPYERPDDYVRTAELVSNRPHPERQPVLIWAPLKDLETFDRFLGALETTRPSSLVVAQARLHPLDDPMRMNGCALVLVDLPDLMDQAQAVCGWVAERLGGPDAAARVERLA